MPNIHSNYPSSMICAPWLDIIVCYVWPGMLYMAGSPRLISLLLGTPDNTKITKGIERFFRHIWAELRIQFNQTTYIFMLISLNYSICSIYLFAHTYVRVRMCVGALSGLPWYRVIVCGWRRFVTSDTHPPTCTRTKTQTHRHYK